jgi:ribosomal protein S18 acetylase RimI-like enzyme
MRITALTAADAPQYRELMLEAYVQAADAFTSTAEERSREPLSWWANRIASPTGLSQSFGAFQAEQLVGTVAIEYSAKPKTAHSALVIGMYVRPEARRLGAGALLMQAAIAAARARPGLRMLRLTVTHGNAAAVRLYESVGFSAWGTEPMAILTPSGYKAKVHMAMHLHGPRDAND